MSKNSKAFEDWYKNEPADFHLWTQPELMQLGWRAALSWVEDRISESTSIGEALSKIIQELESPYIGDDDDRIRENRIL